MIKGALERWTELVRRAGLWVLLAVVALAALALNYTADNLGMNASTKEMLSPELPWRQLDLEYERHFPHHLDNIVAVVEAATPDQALDAAGLLHQRLREEQALFVSVYYPPALPLFRESGLLFSEVETLQDLSDQLAAMQPFIAGLARDPSLRGLFDLLSAAMEAVEDGADLELEPVLEQLDDAAAALQANRPFRVSWQTLMTGGAAPTAADPTQRQFILLRPRLEQGAPLPATAAIEKIRSIWEELRQTDAPGATLSLTGTVVLAHEELLSVMRGARQALFLALALVTIIMLAGLGSVRLVLAALFCLLTGLIFTAAFAALAVGELNLISVAFAVLYLGLGVDFAIHYCLRYREGRAAGEDNGTALRNASVKVGGALFLCAASTATGFFAFIPTAYTGVAELGLISGVGMFISLAVTLTVLPALLGLFPLRGGGGGPARAAGASAGAASRVAAVLVRLPTAHPGKIIGGLFVLAACSAALLTQARFDHNTLNLQDQDNESVATFRRLLADPEVAPWTGVFIAADGSEADRHREAFAGLEEVERVLWLPDFIPARQDEKLAVIDEMALLLGDLPEAMALTDIGVAERAAALTRFREALGRSRLTDPVIRGLHDKLARLEQSLPAASEGGAQTLARLEHSLLASLPGRLQALQASLQARPIAPESLPESLKRRWLSAEGRHRLEIYPKADMQDNQALRAFVQALQSVSGRVIGSPVINLEASDAVAAAFGQAFLGAFVVITLMLLLLFRRKRDAPLALLPLLTATLLTGGASVLAGIPLNFANVIALPLLLGMGVDSAIHIIHRHRVESPAGRPLLATSAARGVLVSSLTTMGGIGNLALSPHDGTASLGALLTIGIGATMVCALLLLPALLTLLEKHDRA